jgi:phosphoribosyl 1,2-cyclic phosphodiesterase
MTQFRTLISGSSGNAVFLSANGANILIDCGTSGKGLAACLCETDARPDDIDYILVTHEHIDHARGVGVLSRRYDIPVVASAGTWDNMLIGDIAEKNQIALETCAPIDLRGIQVTPFAIPHDAAMPTGFRFDVGNESYAVATDMGRITDTVKAALRGCDAVLLESNYDADMLETGPYPYPLKRRISGANGHLCNDDAGLLCRFLVENNTKHVLLGHLSNENNSPETAFSTVTRELAFAHIQVGRDVLLSVAPRYSTSHNTAC